MESLRLLTAEPQDPPAVLLSLLLSTAYLERAVGDVSGAGAQGHQWPTSDHTLCSTHPGVPPCIGK